jgi:hypothetical protein
MNDINVFNYGAIPRKCDRAKAYLYFKRWAGRFFEFEGARSEDCVVRVVLLASLTNGYVEGSANLLDLCGQTVRNHLRYQDPSSFLKVNHELVNRMKKLGALSKPLILAIDWHDEMYYGDPEAEGVVGTRRRRGSHYAYRFATASVLLDGERLTVAAAPMTNEPLVKHVKKLLTQTSELGVKIKLLLFDRGYYSVDLMRYLDSLGVGYVIQLPSRIKGLNEGEDRVYTTRTHKRRRSEQVSFRLVTLRDEGKLFVFATNTSLKPKKIREGFRKRWGIETSYRMIRKFHVKTTSKLYRLRILYFYLAVVLYNMWVLLNYRDEVEIPASMLKLHVMLSLLC